MYNHKEIEKKWQEFWEKNKTFKTDNPIFDKEKQQEKPKYYVLDMFPYPSGSGLHVGHPKGYTANDIIARYKHAKGFNVLHPMGWDAFGLPAENYAIKTGIHPNISTKENIEIIKNQIKSLGMSYDWDREIDTTDPKYYKWTQWIFAKMFEAGLAYEQDLPINFCPSCKTGLANEEVLSNGTCDRCGTLVIKKKIRQWVLAITKYADRLTEDIKDLDWPEGIKDMQRQWIGRSEGCEFEMKMAENEEEGQRISGECQRMNEEGERMSGEGERILESNKRTKEKFGDKTFEIIGYSQQHSLPFISVYTTRVDTVFGMTYAIIAPDHKDINNFITKEQKKVCEEYIETTKNKSDLDRTGTNKDKTGVFTGSYVINPFNNEKVPLWIADYVLGNYGTGAVMAVPAHDERDFEFAQKYGIEIRQSIKENATCELWTEKKCLIEDGILINSGEFSNLTSKEAREKMTTYATENGFGFRKVNYKLRDWLFSRQRYWGEPIPLIHIEENDSNKLINLNFRDGVTIETILNGSKLMETRAMNPEEKDRYFGNIKTSDCVIFTDLVNSVKYLVKVKEIFNWSSLEELFQDKDSLVKIFPYDGAHATLIDLKNRYGAYSVNYLEKAQKNGIIGFTFEIVSKIYDGLYTKIIVDKNLPLKLPEIEKYEPSSDGQSPLSRIEEFVNVKLGNNLNGKRETNTMPQWGGSCWYYLRFIDPKNDEALVGNEVEKYWGNVDSYVGGAEHTVLHLLYARFWYKFLYDIGVVSNSEPFAKLRNQGMILAFAYQTKNGGLVSNDLVEEKPHPNPLLKGEGITTKKYFNKETGEELEKIIAKMSKSLKNVVNPDDIIKEYGADSLRLYEMYMADFKDSAPWDTSKIIGVVRFLDKIWNLFENGKVGENDEESMKLLHKTIKKVGEDIENYKFNTAIAQLMILVNYGHPKDENLAIEWKETFLKLLHPFAPYIAEELWEKTSPHPSPSKERERLQGESGFTSIFFEKWPKYDEKIVVDNEIEIAIQVLGKLRGTIKISKNEEQESVLTKAKANEEVKKWLEGKEIVKEIYVPGKIVNFVIK